jgi:hypothetical protein
MSPGEIMDETRRLGDGRGRGIGRIEDSCLVPLGFAEIGKLRDGHRSIGIAFNDGDGLNPTRLSPINTQRHPPDGPMSLGSRRAWCDVPITRKGGRS